MRKPVLLLASVALAVLLVSGVAQAVTEGAVLDAHVFYTPNEVTPIDSEPGGIPGPLSQPFVAQNTGHLTDVQVMVARDAGSCGIRVKVVEFVPGSSNYQVLSEGTLPAKATDGGPASRSLEEVTFTDPAHVVAGNTYALLLSIDCGLGWWGVVSGGEPDTNNPYWPTYLSGYDGAFAVYVVPDPPPPPKPTTEQECKKGGYKEFGFKNQGQCIAFVNRAAHNR